MVNSTSPERAAMYSSNRLQIGLFGPNCSSGRAVTMVPERWSGTWPDNLKLARMADEAGIDFLLPIARWKGYGGDTDYQGATLETLTWASGLLASTKRITVFGTVHAPLFNPVIAAKECVTADHIGNGRFGLNLVVGWNEGEFEMFGVEQREHEKRYEYAQEWIDAVKLTWSPKSDFDFEGQYLKLKGIRAKPKPVGGTRPLIMNAGASPTGRAFAVRNCDAFFLQASRTSSEETAASIKKAKDLAREHGREIGCYSVGVVTCRRNKKEAEDYYQHAILENADFSAIDRILGDEGHHARDQGPGGVRAPAPLLRQRHGRAAARRRSRSCREDDGGAQPRRPHRHGHLAGQLSRRAAVLLRRGAAAARTDGRARETAREPGAVGVTETPP